MHNQDRILEKYSFSPGDWDKINEVETGTIYYVTEGRNAWHSTWIKRYRSKCMHTNLKSAKLFAESQRKNGSVFTIRDLPCIVFRSKSKTVVITEINSIKPLENHELNENFWKLKKSLRASFKDRQYHLCEMVKAFHPKSFFWGKKINSESSVMVLEHKNPTTKIHKKKPKYTSIESSSSGSDYFLDWLSTPNSISDLPISEISKNITMISSYSQKGKSSSNKKVTREDVEDIILCKIESEGRMKNLNEDLKRNTVSKFLDTMLSAYTIEALYKSNPETLTNYLVHWINSFDKRTYDEAKEIIIELAVNPSSINEYLFKNN